MDEIMAHPIDSLRRIVYNASNLYGELSDALDPLSSQKIEGKLMELKKDYTIVLVTHILRQARRLADYVVFLYLDELVEHGPAQEIFANPKEPGTQAYVKGDIS